MDFAFFAVRLPRDRHRGGVFVRATPTLRMSGAGDCERSETCFVGKEHAAGMSDGTRTKMSCRGKEF